VHLPQTPSNHKGDDPQSQSAPDRAVRQLAARFGLPLILAGTIASLAGIGSAAELRPWSWGGFEQQVDDGLTWRPDYSRRFLVRDTRCSDHPSVRGDENTITIVDFYCRRLWVLGGDILSAQNTDAYAAARIASGAPALIYIFDRDYATRRGRWRQ
jgi:hypothetical protein